MAEDSLSTTIQAVADKLAKAAEGLVTVKVRTLVGTQALSDIGSDGGMKIAQGTEGAYTACNMATGDIVACFSDKVVNVADAKALHEQAVTLGTQIFRANLEMLKKVLLDLIDKQRTTG